MATFEVSWSAFGSVWVSADSEEEAIELAQEEVDYGLESIDCDGSDVGDYIYKQED